jgi:Zn-dependent peptidase ImmA (M78 family)
MTQETVAANLKIPRSAVSEIETGQRELSAVELLQLSRLFGEPMEHLLGTSAHEPDEELVMLRAEAVDAPARAELRRFVARCADYQQLEEWTGSVRTPELRQLRAILSAYPQARTLADEERQRFDLGVTPAHQLLVVLEDRVGIKVLTQPIGPHLSGASVQSERFGPAILLNSTNTPQRQIFTLAHEYFHLLTRGRVKGSKGAQPVHLCEPPKPGVSRDAGEELANQFAAQLLVPPQHFVDQIKQLVEDRKTLSNSDLIALAHYFGVSVTAIVTRMAMLNMIPGKVAREAYKDPELRQSVKAQAGEQVLEPTRFKRLAVKAYLAEHISRSRLAELLDVNTADVDREVTRFGGEEAGRDVRFVMPR